ncbi:hypothetical protein N6H14_16300 [Paenibacillus sp. CC-CFT747]|nr:hypothetical protein N6H14_16300 [Paenibacillus sp. CC-CFT747]
MRSGEEEVRLIGLESALHKKTNRIQYLEPGTKTISITRDGSLFGGELSKAASFQSPLEGVRVRGGNLWVKDFDNYERRKLAEDQARKQAEEREKQEFLRRTREEERRVAAEARRARENEEKKRVALKDAYKSAFLDRHQFRGRITPAEQRLFDRLCKKHGFTDENLPGLFQLELEHSDLILTPPQVWQLWVYNEISEQYDYCIKQNKPPRIWLDRTKERFIDMRKKGTLRIAKHTDDGANYIFTMYNYIDKLNECGMLQQLGHSTAKYHDILVNRLPIFPKHNENIYLKMHFDGHSHSLLDEAYVQYREQMAAIQAACRVRKPSPASTSKREVHPASTRKPLHHESVFNRPVHEVSIEAASPVRVANKEPLETVVHYRALLERCKASELLRIYPEFHSHIKLAEDLFSTYDATGVIDWGIGPVYTVSLVI